MLDSKLVRKIVEKNQLIPEKKLEELSRNKIPLMEFLLNEKIVSEELLYELIANELNVPYISLKKELIRKDLLFLIPENFARYYEVVIFDRTNMEIRAATVNADNLELLSLLQKHLGYDIKINLYLTNYSGLKSALKQYQKGLKAEFQEITKEQQKDEQPDNLKELAQDLPIVRIVETLLEYAIFENSSDIHIEPEENKVTVRYRVDGVLKKVMELPKNIQPGLIARIKILSNLKLDEHRLPQDGRFKISTEKYKVSFRVSILPSFDGEKIVLRLLNEKSQTLTLEQLGFHPKVLEIIKRNIRKPHGMILVTGPTGSGKTTTLYTILGILNTSDVNITTVEDPIEYRMPGITQSQISQKLGFTFANGLRAILRQDPNIIMIGEIRDNETSGIAVHAAMTGHLVLSTLHTNDAVTAIPRLAEMDVPRFLISSTVNLIIAQRLVRKICSNCIESYNLEKKDLENLGNQINIKNILKKLESDGQLAPANNSMKSILFYHGKGCRQCDNQGFKGRIGIYEIIEVTSDISELIIKGATKDELSRILKEKGMLTMLEDGFIKAKNGITTIEEILRVTKE